MLVFSAISDVKLTAQVSEYRDKTMAMTARIHHTVSSSILIRSIVAIATG